MLQALRSAKVAGPVARGADAALGADELWHNAAVIAALLPPPSPGSMVTFAFGHDRAAFAAALLGTWLAGHGAALPENDRREYIVPVMSRPESVAFLHDTGVGRGIDVSRLLAERRGAAVEVPDVPAEDPERIVLALHTVTGDGQVRVDEWNARDLLIAIDAIVDSMELDAGAVVVHGFTPAFRPAVLVGLLAPLRVGGGFLLDAPETAEDLIAAAGRIDGGVLLCSVSQLRQLAALSSGALRSVPKVVCYGTPSSGIAQALGTLHDVVVEPILDEHLEPADECVERLLEIPGIEDAAVARVSGDATALIAVVGSDSVLLTARSAAAAVFAGNVELVVQAVPELPWGPNHRIPHGDFCALFGRGRDGLPITREIEWRTEPSSEDGTSRFRTKIPERLTFFEGHFTTYPVLAGGVQLQELVLPCVRVAAPELGELRRLDAIKFRARIAPADEIEVSIRTLEDGQRVQFEIRCGDTVCTTGKLSFVPREVAENESE